MSTPKMGIPIPGERENPFWATVGQTWDAFDSWFQSLREDAALVVLDAGGTWTVNVGTDEVSWDSDIVIQSPDGTGVVTIPAGTATIQDGHVLFAGLPGRPISGAITPTVGSASALPRNVAALVLGVRDGATFHQRWGAGGGGPVLDSDVFTDPVGYTADASIVGCHGKSLHNGGAASGITLTLEETGFANGDRFWITRIGKREIRVKCTAGPGGNNTIIFGGIEIPGGYAAGFLLDSSWATVSVVVAIGSGGEAQFVVTLMSGAARLLGDDGGGLEVEGFQIRSCARPHRRKGALLDFPTDPSAGRGAGSGAAGFWTPRIVKGKGDFQEALNGLESGMEYEIVRHDIKEAFTGATQGFIVSGDVTQFYSRGRRFAVGYAPGNNTTDTEYLVRSASYNMGLDETVITIEDAVGGPGYIEKVVAAFPAPTFGNLYTAFCCIPKPGRYRITAKARGCKTGYTGLRIVPNALTAFAYDLSDGHAVGVFFAACVDRRDGFADPSGDLTEVQVEASSFLEGNYPIPAEPLYFEVQQFIEAEYEDLGAGWCSWGYPINPANVAEFQVGVGPTSMCVVIEEANS